MDERVESPPLAQQCDERFEAGRGQFAIRCGVHHELAGAFTGEISAPMLHGLATWVIVGHSERRRDAGETDELIGRKLTRAVDAGLRPILCVGEHLADRESGIHGDVVHRQIVECLRERDADAVAATLVDAEPHGLLADGLAEAVLPVHDGQHLVLGQNAK